MSFEDVVQKHGLIQEHRQEQLRDIRQRHAHRKKLVARLNAIQAQLACIEGCPAGLIADWLEERRDLQQALAQQLEDDRIAEEHWAKHFQLHDFSLTRGEMTTLRHKRKMDSGAEVPTLLPGREEAVPRPHSRNNRIRDARPKSSSLPCMPRVVGREMAALRDMEMTAAPVAGKNDATGCAKDLNRSAVIEMGRRNFRRAKHLLDEAHRVLSEQFGDTVKKDPGPALVHAATTTNMGNLMELCGQSLTAGKCFSEAYNLEHHFNALTIETALSRASWLSLHGKSKEAVEVLQSSQHLAVTKEHKNAIRSLLGESAEQSVVAD
jgi:hypothetical protein